MKTEGSKKARYISPIKDDGTPYTIAELGKMLAEEYAGLKLQLEDQGITLDASMAGQRLYLAARESVELVSAEIEFEDPNIETDGDIKAIGKLVNRFLGIIPDKDDIGRLNPNEVRIGRARVRNPKEGHPGMVVNVKNVNTRNPDGTPGYVNVLAEIPYTDLKPNTAAGDPEVRNGTSKHGRDHTDDVLSQEGRVTFTVNDWYTREVRENLQKGEMRSHRVADLSVSLGVPGAPEIKLDTLQISDETQTHTLRTTARITNPDSVNYVVSGIQSNFRATNRAQGIVHRELE